MRTELTEDITSIESRIIQPANNARQNIAPIRKTIKKREDKRFDVEKTQDKVHKLHRKATRTPKEDAQLAKAEDDLATLSEVRDDATRNDLLSAHLTCVTRSLKSPTTTCERPYPP